jgi:hypothetical protein
MVMREIIRQHTLQVAGYTMHRDELYCTFSKDNDELDMRDVTGIDLRTKDGEFVSLKLTTSEGIYDLGLEHYEFTFFEDMESEIKLNINDLDFRKVVQEFIDKESEIKLSINELDIEKVLQKFVDKKVNEIINKGNWKEILIKSVKA